MELCNSIFHEPLKNQNIILLEHTKNTLAKEITKLLSVVYQILFPSVASVIENWVLLTNSISSRGINLHGKEYLHLSIKASFI